MKLLAPIKNDEDIVNKKYVDTAADQLQSQVNNKADKEHNHDDRYYTESEVDSKVSGINKTISDHTSDTSNPHSVTKSQVGLGNVENKSSATIRGEITKSNITTALGYTPLNQSLKGSANGLAELDSNGKVPSSQLPSFVDDVVEGYLSGGKFYKESAHTTEISGETGKIYIDLSTEKTYRWSGSAFVVISETLALGETSSTAYRGDRGKIAYDHSQSTHARIDATKVEASSTNGNIKINGTETTVYKHPSGTNPHGTTKSDVGLGNVGNFKAVSTVANQGLTDTEKTNARANIGAGTSSFSGSYNDLTNKPTIPTVGNGTITIKQAGTTKGTFTTNQTGNTTIELTDDNTDTKVTQTVTTSNANYPLLLAPNGQTATATTTAYFDSGVTLNPNTNTIAANISGSASSATKATQDSTGQQINTTYIKNLSISGTNLSYTKGDSTVSTVIVNDLLSGSALRSNGTTATTTKGYSYGIAGVTTSPYNYTKWYAYLDSGITTLTNGMIIKVRIPVAGCNYGTCIAINGSDFHPVVFNTNSVVTTHYGVGVELLLMYDSNGSAKVYSNSATSTAISGVWRVMNNYNSNTTNTAGSTNTSSKIFLVGTTSQTTYAQTYSNSKVYVDKDSCLYSNGTKVSVEGHTHAYLPLSGGTLTDQVVMSKSSGDTYFTSNRTDLDKRIAFGFSAAGNRGLYDSGCAKWLIYANKSNKVTVNGDIVTGAISAESSSWTGTKGYTFNYATGRNRALILAWMEYSSSTYTGFNFITISSSTTTSTPTTLIQPPSTTGLYYNVRNGNISIEGGAGGASYKCTVLWFTV